MRTVMAKPESAVRQAGDATPARVLYRDRAPADRGGGPAGHVDDITPVLFDDGRRVQPAAPCAACNLAKIRLAGGVASATVTSTLLRRLHNPRGRVCGCAPECFCQRNRLGRLVRWYLPRRLHKPVGPESKRRLDHRR
jgi:hypothetical protein